jgi:peptide/nickel transport system ATP-binding protein/oligopeptide transport system ATP-binding protein
MAELINIVNLQTHFKTDGKIVRAVDNISFSLQEKETVAVVGESGSGKSVTSLSIMRLIPNPPGEIVGGQVIFHGEDLLTLPEKKMREIRGNKISMIFQEPMTSLNPVHRIGDQIAEAIILHQGLKKQEAWNRAVDLLRTIGIPSPEKRAFDYPHQLSGGMRQRVMIAMALSCRPDLLIADEPTTALDVTIQAQILDLMRKMREDFGMAILLITHDLAVVAEMADRVIVMYAGQVMEEASVEKLFEKPLHPYTIGLLKSIPKMDDDHQRLYVIEGSVPDLSMLPSGCSFHPRCPNAGPRCSKERPSLLKMDDGRQVCCWLHTAEGVNA